MDAARNKLVTEHLEIARAVAQQCANQFNLQHLFDDLLGYANQGLVEAAGRYSPAAGTRFSTFCWTRVRGAVIDGIRKHYFGRQQLACHETGEASRPFHIAYTARDGRDQLPASSTVVDDPEAEVDGRRLRRALLGALAALPDTQRDIVVRKHCRNELIHEIAADLGIHRSNAARQHMAGLRSLRDALEAVTPGGREVWQ